MQTMVHLSRLDLSRALGVSGHSLQRQVLANANRLEPALGSKVWRFAELLARSTKVFGTQASAEQWLISNVTGLDGQQPIELLRTSVGAQLVDDFLGRLEYGVYT